MADFKQAVQWMKEGKKVKAVAHGCAYFYISKGRIVHNNTITNKEEYTTAICSLANIECKDWEIYEEKKKTLSDKIQDDDDIPMCKLAVEDVKRFIRDLKEEIFTLRTRPSGSHTNDYNAIIHKLAGDKLI